MKMTHLLIFSHAKISQMAFEALSFQLFLAMEKMLTIYGGGSIMVGSNHVI